MSTKIEWTEQTWNPIIGCSKISEGCSNCYAERMANRLANMSTTDYYLSVTAQMAHVPPTGWNGRTIFIAHQLEKPFKWKKPKMIFVCSMGDLFHESVPFEWIDNIIDVIRWTKQHTYQILTKRPDRMKEYFTKHVPNKYMMCKGDYLDNIWIGVTAENQEQANKRIPVLLKIPAAKRFVSCEPLLSDIDFPWYQDVQKTNGTLLSYLDWVIVGRETGPKARPMQKEWIENIYNQCKVANVAFFDKRNELGLNLKQFPQ